MKLVIATLRKRLLANGARPGGDPVPVLKLFDPGGSATWLFTGMDPDDPDRLFGLCDPGQGLPELGAGRIVERGAVFDEAVRAHLAEEDTP